MARSLQLGGRHWMAAQLLEQGMPPGEVAAVFEARDPAVVHMYLELHAELLSQQLAEQRRTLSRIERFLVRRMRNDR